MIHECCFTGDAHAMDLAILTHTLDSASTPGERIAAEAGLAAFRGRASHPDPTVANNSHAPDVAAGDAGARVRLRGLRGAAHLNGREGIVRGEDPANPARVVVRFADGSEVSVKRDNCEIL